jgi:thiol-disulfide isomerase/thioredoxin
MGMKTKTTSEFISDARLRHGDLYDYSLVVYVNSHAKIEIKCLKHGVFKQSPTNHLAGKGCSLCHKENLPTYKLLGEERFIARSIDVHGNKYDYSNVKYKGSHEKVKIKCLKHDSFFYQSPTSHLSGNGCSLCAKEVIADKLKKTNDDFIKAAISVHGEKYDYSTSYYNGCYGEISIRCKKHDFIFQQSPANHLSGRGCPRCAGNTRLTRDQFIKKASIAHGDRYSYDELEYVSCSNKVKILCKTHNYYFYQLPHSHIYGSGCPKCAKYGFNKGFPTFLYYLKVNNGSCYKVGITKRRIEDRFRKDISKIEIVKSVLFYNGEDALSAEREILNDFKEYKYQGENVLKDGNTEMFGVDILPLGLEKYFHKYSLAQRRLEMLDEDEFNNTTDQE